MKQRRQQQQAMDEQEKDCISVNCSEIKEDRFLGIGIHSQVEKIKQEMEKITHPSLQQPEIMPPVSRKITGNQISRSPLGLSERLVSVGN